MDEIAPSIIRYIKLGPGGRWEAAALGSDRIEWGLPSDPHELAVAGDWDAVAAGYRISNPARGTATGYTNEARAFYDGDPATLWITFARGRMWWALADPEVHWRGGDGVAEGTRYRIVPGGWRDLDIVGRALNLDRLSTRLTKLAAYQRTICGLTGEQQQLCLRYISATRDAEQSAAATARDTMRATLTTLIRRLTWQDFEQFVDLAMARSGWMRISAVGGTTKDVDLVVRQPLTGERMAIQVKSFATQSVINDYSARLALRGMDERSMLICHSSEGDLVAPPAPNGKRLELIVGPAVADLAISSGLIDWVIERAR